MKNKKFKLFASLTSLVMVVAVMAVGVWAAQSATVSLSGTIGFNATSAVRADIAVSSGDYEGTTLKGSMTDATVNGGTFTAAQETAAATSALSLRFTQDSENPDVVYDKVIKVVINNNNSNEGISVKIKAGASAALTNVKAYYSQSEDYTKGSKELTTTEETLDAVAAGVDATTTIWITFDVQDTMQTANVTLDYVITLGIAA